MKIVDENASQFGIETIQQLVWNQMFLDRFQTMLSKDFVSLNQPFLGFLTSVITAENFPRLLQFFSYTTSQLTRAKIALLVGEILQTGKAKDLLQKLIEKQGNLARSISFST